MPYLYADDIQIYVPRKPEGKSSQMSFLFCLEEVKCWLEQNRLQLNVNKSEVIIFGPDGTDSDLKDKLGLGQ